MTQAARLTRRQLGYLGAGGLALAATGCSFGHDTLLHATDAQPDGYPTVEAVREFGRLLSERSGGRLDLKLYPGGQLGNERDTLEITIFGGIDVNRVSIAPLGSISAEARVPTLPFIFRDTAHMRAALDGAPGETILSSLEPHGLIGLCFYDAGARSFYTTKKPVRTPEDLKGMKIRVMSSDMFVSMVNTLGGDATPMAYGEVYQGLMQGVIDGAENNWPSYFSSRHFEVAGYYSLTQHVMAPEVLLMSERCWAGLDEADRALVRACAKESVTFMRALWDERSAEAQAEIEAAGIEIVEPDRAPFVEAVQPVWERYLATPELKGLSEAIQAVEA
ncbi:MAG: TRAP transporter substrate-binding protein [Henriciella sp.]|uniref:TRAP transporter substrate-binding protein n=1 Tax=Henriciella sp. TaxID=1968823 RepID=UPI003C71F556